MGEIEVTKTWEASEYLRTPTLEHPIPLEVKVLRSRNDVRPITLDKVRQIIEDEHFPRQGEAWKPLSRDIYQALVEEWE